MTNFWTTLNAPFFVLAPMEDVTDTVFREIVLSVSNPEVLKVVCTEFTNTDGLTHKDGRDNVGQRLKVNKSEIAYLKANNVKLVAQIWGNKPELFRRSAEIISDMELFDGIDINMGCPVKKVVKKNTCSALIRQPKLASDIIQATKAGTSLPISVKTRIGFHAVETEAWIGHLLKENIAALTVHGRTQRMQSDGEADWNEIAKAVQLRNEIQAATKIIGNGDVLSTTQGYKLAHDTMVDGLMVGRGVFQNPWMFRIDSFEPTIEQRLELITYHINLYKDTWGTQRNFHILKRFFKIYIFGFKGASKLRNDLMDIDNYTDALLKLDSFLQELS